MSTGSGIFAAMETLEPRLLLSNVYYARPQAQVSAPHPDGTSPQSAFTIADFWRINGGAGPGPGDTLNLLDGEYTAPADMINPPNGDIDGAAGQPITIQAVNDGRVMIYAGDDASKFYYGPIRLRQNDWFVIAGINATLASRTTGNLRDTVDIAYSSHVRLSRLAAWNADDGNRSIYSIWHCSDVNLEDCAGWGVGRKVFQFLDCSGVNVIRAWGRWELSNEPGPKWTYSVAYDTQDILFENCIGTWDSWQMDGTVQSALGVFGADGNTVNLEPANVRILGCLAYETSGEQFDPVYYGNNIGELKGIQVKDFLSYMVPNVRTADFGYHRWPGANIQVGPRYACVSTISNGHAYAVLRAGTTGTREPDWPTDGTTVLDGDPVAGVIWQDLGKIAFTVENITTIGNEPYITDGVGVSGQYHASSPQALIEGNGDILHAQYDQQGKQIAGADLMHRYVDGVLQPSQNLWPWPMDDRIFNAMVKGGYDAAHCVHVTNTIMNLGREVGDCTGDWIVDTNDLDWVFNHLGEVQDPGKKFLLGDTNLDGVIDVNDLNDVFNHMGITYGPGQQHLTAQYQGAQVDSQTSVTSGATAFAVPATASPRTFLAAGLGLAAPATQDPQAVALPFALAFTPPALGGLSPAQDTAGSDGQATGVELWRAYHAVDETQWPFRATPITSDLSDVLGSGRLPVLFQLL